MNYANRILAVVVLFFNIHLVLAQDTTSVKLLPVEITDRKVYTPEKISLSRSNFLSAPATFDDPSRLLMRYPGFTVSNDQNNAILFEGLPSHFSTWSLYGAQITNPNHLSNAGTPNDRASRSAGGVNMFSGQVIGGLDYHTGTDSPAHGIGGVADLSIRSPYQNSVTANISLIGMEAGLDQVYSDGNSSLLANYRYSTIGILDKLGVELGDEIINYQDALAEYRKKFNNIEIRFTAVYGKSSNNHEASALQGADNIGFKNIQDIEYSSTNNAWTANIKSDTYFITFAYSSRHNNRSSNFIFDDRDELILSNSKENIFSFYVQKEWIKNNYRIFFSTNANRFKNRIVDQNSRNFNFNRQDFEREIFFNDHYLELRPKVLMDWSFGKHQKIKFGSYTYSNTRTDEFFLLPFISYHSRIKSINAIFSFQNDRQSIAPEILGMQGYFQNAFFENIDLKSMNSSVFKLDLNTVDHGVVLFSNYLYNTPVSSTLSQLGDVRIFGLDEIGNLPIEEYSATNDVVTFGVKMYTSFDLLGFRCNANYTWMDSQMNAKANSEVPLDFSNALNVSIDKSFYFSKRKSLRITTSYHFRNGFQSLNIDLEESRQRLQTVYSGIDLSRLNNYQRLDLRLSFVKKGKWKNVISLDVQNVLNRQNDAFYYFDPLLDEVQLQRQLGLIPILSWRVVF